MFIVEETPSGNVSVYSGRDPYLAQRPCYASAVFCMYCMVLGWTWGGNVVRFIFAVHHVVFVDTQHLYVLLVSLCFFY